MAHWLLDAIRDSRKKALEQAEKALIYRELVENHVAEIDYPFIERTAEALELAVLDLLMARPDPDPDSDSASLLTGCAGDAFRLYRVLPRHQSPFRDGTRLLRLCALGVLGDMGMDAARLLRESPWPDLPLGSGDWGNRVLANVLDVWLRLIRKQGWEDRDLVLRRIAELRTAQTEFEERYLRGQEIALAKASALELMCQYHLAKAAEILALFMTDGVVNGSYQPKQLLEAQYDRIAAICRAIPMVELEPLSRLLAACSSQMVENSIWTVTRAVNTRVTKFVRALVDRGRGDKAIFEVLPPQRQTLAERGLLGSSRRAVVVCLPTSSGKTLIAQFRILQALNQFDQDRGWVAYLVPTRTLVNQITRRLRRDFSPLGVVVEQVSPALEVNSVETDMLRERGDSRFSVLVSTPEKLDLLIRQGWEKDIGRPLTLVVVDEAHNIQSRERGLGLELLLATVNSECQNAQFLLLTPFVTNARQVARWLGGNSSDDICLSVDWQPNDRVLAIATAEKGESMGRRSHAYSLQLETVHTSRHTLSAEGILPLPKSLEVADTFAKVNSPAVLAAATAQAMSRRGQVIVMHAKPSWVWSLASKLQVPSNRLDAVSDRVKLVQDFVRLEFGDEFPLVDLLSYGIGVHHAGLSDDVRALMEWLFEENELRFLVATTTIAQGVNFPVTGVVMASHQYPSKYGPTDMPPEDFWNIAGRAGRIDQGSLGAVVLVADSEEKGQALREFINQQAGALNSELVRLAKEAQGMMRDLGSIVNYRPEWSRFLQYLAHTYRQMGSPERFLDQIEVILRGTFGFESLRSESPALAEMLLEGIREYAIYMSRPRQPLGLVDSTGFSLQSINSVLSSSGSISAASWSPALFGADSNTLKDMMGVLLRVPELRDNLEAVIGGDSLGGRKLALIVKDWVNGESVASIASRYFKKPKDTMTDAITRCGQNLYGKVTQTVSWGMGALLSITGRGLDDEAFGSVQNLPSRVYYGVSDDSAIPLRVLGVPRQAATPLARRLNSTEEQPLSAIRDRLRALPEAEWVAALGEDAGRIYRKVWRILGGVD